MTRAVFAILGLIVAGGYLAAQLRGWEFTATHRQPVPVSVRNSPGGYRSFHFWHSGYHGGK